MNQKTRTDCKYQSEMNRSLSLNHGKWIDKRKNWNGEKNEVTDTIIYRIKVDKIALRAEDGEQ